MKAEFQTMENSTYENKQMPALHQSILKVHDPIYFSTDHLVRSVKQYSDSAKQAIHTAK